jgi:hypothetical protein
MDVQRTSDSVVSLGRHKRACSVCAHKQREEVENAFISWRSPTAIAQEFGLSDRASVYRHAHALGFFEKRRRNIRAALERIIEKAGEVDVTASAVVAAVQAYAKINSAGEWIDRTETVSMNDLFDRMSTQELETVFIPTRVVRPSANSAPRCNRLERIPQTPLRDRSSQFCSGGGDWYGFEYEGV